MLFNYHLYPVFTILVLSFVQVKSQTTTKIMDDITSFQPNTYCKFQANSFRCGRSTRTIFRYYYNTERGICEPFVHGNCFHPYNVFTSRHLCNSECKEMNLIPTFRNLTENIYCRLQPEFGPCNSYYPRWYYDISELTCKGFSYSGCGGNQNNFDNAHKCLDTCANHIKQCKLPTDEKPKEILSCYA